MRSVPAATELATKPVPLALTRIFLQEDVNFLITNRIPRRYATLLMGRFSRIRSRFLTRMSIAVWRLFDSDLDLGEARTTEFACLQDCFTRKLRKGARRIDGDPRVVASPCDAAIGAFGVVEDGQAIQVKGFPYRLTELLGEESLARRYQRGKFITLRLRPSMYHRFHAPCDGRIRRVKYISGDTWNVNPIALKRVERLFCRNERAVLDVELSREGAGLTLVPVAAILVASIRLRFLPMALDLKYRGANDISCDARFLKGAELGCFESGSTIVVFASSDFEFASDVAEGATIRVGAPLFTSPVPISQTIGEDDERFD
jgi:phosphatidylserine decarboxylase